MSDSTEAAPADAPLQTGSYMWNVYRRSTPTAPVPTQTIRADTLTVEGGAAVFSVGSVVTWVFPPGEYLYVEKI